MFREAVLVACGIPWQIQFRVGFHVLLASLFIMQPSIPLDLFAKRAQRWLMFSSLSTIPPMSFSAELRWVTHRNAVQGTCRLKGVSASITGDVIAGCRAGQECLRVSGRYRRILFRGLWKCVRLILGCLGEDPKVGEWVGSIWMEKEAAWKEQRKIMGSKEISCWKGCQEVPSEASCFQV